MVLQKPTNLDGDYVHHWLAVMHLTCTNILHELLNTWQTACSERCQKALFLLHVCHTNPVMYTLSSLKDWRVRKLRSSQTSDFPSLYAALLFQVCNPQENEKKNSCLIKTLYTDYNYRSKKKRHCGEENALGPTHFQNPTVHHTPKNLGKKPKCTQYTPHLCSYPRGMKKDGKLQWCYDRWNDEAASSNRMNSLFSCAVHNLCCMLHYTCGPPDKAFMWQRRLWIWLTLELLVIFKACAWNAPVDVVWFTQPCTRDVSSLTLSKNCCNM